MFGRQLEWVWPHKTAQDNVVTWIVSGVLRVIKPLVALTGIRFGLVVPIPLAILRSPIFMKYREGTEKHINDSANNQRRMAADLTHLQERHQATLSRMTNKVRTKNQK